MVIPKFFYPIYSMSSTVKLPITNPYYNTSLTSSYSDLDNPYNTNPISYPNNTPANSTTPSNCAYNSLNPTLLYRINQKRSYQNQIKTTQRVQYGPLPKQYPPTYYETGYDRIFNDPDVTFTYV